MLTNFWKIKCKAGNKSAPFPFPPKKKKHKNHCKIKIKLEVNEKMFIKNEKTKQKKINQWTQNKEKNLKMTWGGKREENVKKKEKKLTLMEKGTKERDAITRTRQKKTGTLKLKWGRTRTGAVNRGEHKHTPAAFLHFSLPQIEASRRRRNH